MQKELSSRAVVYLNVDIAVGGNYTFDPKGTVSLQNIFHDAAKKVENPNRDEFDNGRNTVYDTWYNRTSRGASLPS